MIIRRVKLKNFKGHRFLEQNFEHGTNAIYGRNGIGKTSILDAIGFALFDTQPIGTKNVEMILNGANKMEVEVDFEASADDRLYRVKRSMTRKGSPTYSLLCLDDNLIQSTNREGCLSDLRNLMDLPPHANLGKLFTELLGVPQGMLTSVFLEADGKRSQTFAPLLGVEDYKKAFEAMKPALLEGLEIEIHRKEEHHRQLERHLLALPSKQADLLALSTQFQQDELEYQRISEEHTQLSAQLTQSEEEERIFRELEAAQKSLHEETIRLETQATQHQSALHAARQAQATLEAHQEGARAYQEAQKEEARQLKAYQAQQAKQEALHQAQLAAQKADLNEKNLRSRLDEIADAERQIAALHPQIDEYKRLRQQRDQYEAECREYKDILQQNKQIEEEIAIRDQSAQEIAASLQRLPLIEKQYNEFLHLEEEGKRQSQHQKGLEEDQRRYNEMRERIERAKAIEAEAKANTQRLNEEIAALQAETMRLTEERATQQTQINELLEETTQLAARIEREKDFSKQVSGGICPFFEARCKNLSNDQSLRDFLGENLERYQQQHQERQTALKALQQLEKQSRKREAEQQRKLSSAEGQREALLRDLQEKSKEIEVLEKEYREKTDPSEEIEKTKKNLAQMRQRYKALLAQGVREELSKLQEQQNKYQSLRQTLAISRATLEEKNNRLFEIQGAEEKLAPLIERLTALGEPHLQIATLQRKLTEKPRLRKESEKEQKRLEQLHAEVAALQEALLALGRPADALACAREAIEKHREAYEIVLRVQTEAAALESHQKALERCQSLLAQKRQSLLDTQAAYQSAAERFDHEALQALRAQHKAIFGRFHALQGRLEPQRQQLLTLRQEVAMMEGQLVERDQLTTDLFRLKEAKQGFEMLRKVIRDAGPRVTKALIQSISTDAHRIFQEITQRPQILLRWDETFQATLLEAGHERSFSNLSGGEQMAVALSIRLALIRQLSPIRIAFFDEPTAHLDQERRKNLAHYIQQIRDFKQLFVISHDDTFESVTDHAVHLSESP
jgi:exonuclease SbcC